MARVFAGQPERLAAAWRRARFAEARKEGAPPRNQLDSLVEPFIREIGRTLEGKEGSAWSRTRAVLRLSPQRGTRALNEEFAALRRCLLDAVETLGGGDSERAVVNNAVDEAAISSTDLLEHLSNRYAPKPRVPFAGLVVQSFEKAPAVREQAVTGELQAAAH
ncbi:hypothetical protein [Melittangium boletus]|uniref:hypothetical protein n=1 Tax=Melittangium boletus TaxID=83453 RepID=UPI003DA2E490